MISFGQYGLGNPQKRACQRREETELEYKIAKALILARVKNKLTQKELAKRMGTKQSVISRVENAKTTPSLSFLKRLAEVLGTNLVVKFGKYSTI